MISIIYDNIDMRVYLYYIYIHEITYVYIQHELESL